MTRSSAYLPTQKLVSWDDLLSYEVANNCDFFDDRQEHHTDFVVFEGDVDYAGTVDEHTVRGWLVDAGGEDRRHPFLIVDGTFRIGGDLLLGYDLAERLRGHYEFMFFDLLVTGDLIARNVAPGDRSRVLIIGETRIEHGLFLFGNGFPCEFQGPVQARYLVGDPEDTPVLFTLGEDTMVVDSLADLPESAEMFEGELSREMSTKPKPSAPTPSAPSAIALRKQAEEALATDRPQAQAILEQALARFPDDPECIAAYAAVILPNDPERAVAFASKLAESDSGYDRASAVLGLGAAIARGPELVAQASSPREREAASHYEAAVSLFGEGDFEACAGRWVEAVKASRSLGDDAARKALLALFDWLGIRHPISESSRRALMIVL